MAAVSFRFLLTVAGGGVFQVAPIVAADCCFRLQRCSVAHFLFCLDVALGAVHVRHHQREMRRHFVVVSDPGVVPMWMLMRSGRTKVTSRGRSSLRHLADTIQWSCASWANAGIRTEGEMQHFVSTEIHGCFWWMA